MLDFFLLSDFLLMLLEKNCSAYNEKHLCTWVGVQWSSITTNEAHHWCYQKVLVMDFNAIFLKMILPRTLALETSVLF